MLKKTLLSIVLTTSLFSKDFFVETDKDFEATLLKIVKESYINKNINYYVNNIYIKNSFKISKNRIIDYKKLSKLGEKLKQKDYRIKIFKNNQQLNNEERIFLIPKWYVCEYQNICNIKDNMEFFRYDYKDSIMDKKFILLDKNKKRNNVNIKNISNPKAPVSHSISKNGIKEKKIAKPNEFIIKKPNKISKQERINNIINDLLKTNYNIGKTEIKKSENNNSSKNIKKLVITSSLKKQKFVISKNKPVKKKNIDNLDNFYSLISKYYITDKIDKKKNILKELRAYTLKEEVINNIYQDILNYKKNKEFYITGLNTIALLSNNTKYKKELGSFLMSNKKDISISEIQLAYSILNIY